MRGVTVVLGALLLQAPARVEAHGIMGHVHVTGWAIENLPEGEIREFFADPEVLNAALFGAAFTDSGYWPQGGELATRTRAYGEHTHWEPFVEDFVEWIVANDPPPWDNQESRMRAAFLMGCASHGLQDEIFDSLFLYQVGEHDNGDQENADPGTDGFLAMDGHLRFFPERWLPMETLLELYQVLDVEVSEDDIDKAVGVMVALYANERTGPVVAESNGEQYEPGLPWTRANYLDQSIPGSLRAEILPTMHYMEAIWERLHGRLETDAVVSFTYPEVPRRLLGGDASSVDSWVTYGFGLGVWPASVESEVLDAEGTPVAHHLEGTRWGGRESWSRLIRIQMDEDLQAGEIYTVRLSGGLDLIDGRTAGSVMEQRVQVDCAAADDPECPELEGVQVATIDPSEPEGSGEGSGENEGSGVEEGSSEGSGNETPDGSGEGSGETDIPEEADDGGSGCSAAGSATSLASLLGVAIVGIAAGRRRGGSLTAAVRGA